jgi:tRNA threonylcarbamoyladenosine biosynthesis protein TsaB
MIVLALDTTARAGSLALARDGRLVDARAGDPSSTHGQRLPGEIRDLLGAHALGVGDVDVFAVAAGPGSFTGLRVGLATMQGLALVHGRQMAPVSALEALARASRAAAGARPIAAWIDAQRHEVFTALYASASGDEAGTDAGLVEIAAPAVGDPAAILGAWREPPGTGPVFFAGDGARAYRDVILAALGGGAIVADEVPLLAPAIAEMAFTRAQAGRLVAPHAVAPIYIRRPDAELARQKLRRLRPEV